ncbi:MAG: O-antigen ligase family protein [Bacteroidales bacterium]|nr:O-antigen ligase family protein [Bacteroidales bacterium]
MLNKYKQYSGSLILKKPLVLLILFAAVILIALLISYGGIKITIALLFLPFIIVYFNFFFKIPAIGLISVLIFAFTAIGLNRYILNVPLGLSIDVFLVLTYIALFFKLFYEKEKWALIKNDLSLIALIWFIYGLLEFFNPLALSKLAWLYAMRGMSLYFLLTIPLAYLLFNDFKYLKNFLYIWAFFSILATLKGCMQLYYKPDYAEQRWLDAGGGITHILFGELRVFSFYSDAGQFGAAQGQAGIVGTIVALNSKKIKNKIIFGLMGLAGFYGMIISGTRGAMIVPMFGAFLYLIHRKNIKTLAIGLLIMAAVFVFFRYTWIGQSNSQIRRMRTGFRPTDDISLQVRLNNRKILKAYLADKPFGGGIGSAGDWGRRFSPQGFLANVPTDSWYVQIWAEQGIVGLVLYLSLMIYILIKGSFLIMFKINHPILFGISSALLCGIFGSLGASYGNGVFGQLPSGILNYLSMAFIFMAPQFDKRLNTKNIIF